MQPLNTTVRAQLVVDHRLGAGVGQVDDRQPAVPECHPPGAPPALVVRAARYLGADHPLDRGGVGR
jgi:hypothetical protein